MVVAIAATDIAYLLPPDLLLVFLTDAVMPDLVRFYDMYRALPAAVQARAIAAEKLAFDRAILISVPSRWARQSAVALQQQDETKMAEIAWGANIPAIKRAPRTVGNGALRLLFVGSDWQRKGGPIALEVARLLNERGIDCWLDIVGCAADVIDEPVPNHVHFHNFLDKTRTADCAILDRLYRSATVFLLPTGAEAWGIVFAEAAHHGLPSVAYAVGGVTSVVKHGETGLLLPVDARAGDFAAAIERLTGDRKVYVAMSRAALGDARVRLNWEVWAERLEAEIRDRLCALPNRADASAAV